MMWFKQGMFWMYGVVYLCAKCVVNISGSMMQFYLVYVLKVTDVENADDDKKTSIELAVYPCFMFITAIIVST